MNNNLKRIMPALLLSLCSMLCTTAQTAISVKLDNRTTHQYITGFGGFVCSPQFGYNHMSESEIMRVWGTTSTVGCNIMRLYIPIGRSSWNQSLATAKKAKQMGLIVFASPWGQPAEWKTNGTINAKNEDGTTGKLKPENWADYAQYLEDYVQFMRAGGVELDAISIQNEPDWPATYAGCLWSASEIASFVKTYGKTISCKVMAPETLAVSDSYVNALNTSSVLDCFDIYGGHQYGGIGSAYKNLAKKGKEIWMTEYLINWNEGSNTTRNFDFNQDFFNFFTAINTCMLGDFNAWIHYAAKRFYGMLGDGQYGTTNGTVTKRGYVMAHFARFATGMTRIDATWNGSSMEGSAYISQTGDTAVLVIANPGYAATITLDLPFYTQKGETYTTDKVRNLLKKTYNLEAETCRPQVDIAAGSVCTVLFVRSSDRQASDMKGTATMFDRIDDIKPTRTIFGTAYKLSGTTRTFDSSNPLISTRSSIVYGYLPIDERYTSLVMHINKVTTTSTLTAGGTTLTYVNRQGRAVKHDYGRLDLSRATDFDIVLDISPATLTDGCQGILSLACDNSVSHLTISFGNVWFATSESNYTATLSGDYVADDSYVLDYSADPSCASLDMTAVTQLPPTLPWWHEGTNRLLYLPAGSEFSAPNVVTESICQDLRLYADGGNFRPANTLTATNASLTVQVSGARMLMLPFQATIPEGATAYSIDDELHLKPLTTIQPHQPVLIMADGTITFTGSGEVAFARNALDATCRGTYISLPLYAGDYVLRQENGQWGWKRLTEPATLTPFDAYLQIDSEDDFIPLNIVADNNLDVNHDGSVDTQDVLQIYEYMQDEGADPATFDLNHDGSVDTQDVLLIYEYMQNN